MFQELESPASPILRLYLLPSCFAGRAKEVNFIGLKREEKRHHDWTSVRWPTTATAKSIVHGKISISTASLQINFHGIKYNFSRGKITLPWHKHFLTAQKPFAAQTFSHGTNTFSRHTGADLGGGEGRSSHGQNFKTYFFPTTFFDLSKKDI